MSTHITFGQSLPIRTEHDRDTLRAIRKKDLLNILSSKYINDPKARMIGLDIESLDRQVKDKQASIALANSSIQSHHTHSQRVLQDQLEKQADHLTHLRRSQVLLLADLNEQVGEKRAREKEEEIQRKSGLVITPDYKIDPIQFSKGSAQVFAGEDELYLMRKHAQHIQQRDWIQQQIFEKSLRPHTPPPSTPSPLSPASIHNRDLILSAIPITTTASNQPQPTHNPNRPTDFHQAHRHSISPGQSRHYSPDSLTHGISSRRQALQRQAVSINASMIHDKKIKMMDKDKSDKEKVNTSLYLPSPSEDDTGTCIIPNSHLSMKYKKILEKDNINSLIHQIETKVVKNDIEKEASLTMDAVIERMRRVAVLEKMNYDERKSVEINGVVKRNVTLKAEGERCMRDLESDYDERYGNKNSNNEFHNRFGKSLI